MAGGLWSARTPRVKGDGGEPPVLYSAAEWPGPPTFAGRAGRLRGPRRLAPKKMGPGAGPKSAVVPWGPWAADAESPTPNALRQPCGPADRNGAGILWFKRQVRAELRGLSGAVRRSVLAQRAQASRPRPGQPPPPSGTRPKQGQVHSIGRLATHR